MARATVKPLERDIRRAYRTLLKEGASVQGLKIEAETGDFTFLIDKTKPCPPYVDVMQEVEEMIGSEATEPKEQSQSAA
jgi:hypothetical protein